MHDGFHPVSPPLTRRYCADTSRGTSARLVRKIFAVRIRDPQRTGGREAERYPGSATTMKRGSFGGTLGWISLTT